MLTSSKSLVLIAGGGPTGLILALTLAQNGIPVRIIEKSSQFHNGQRGAGIHPRTLELYGFLGALPDFLEGGNPVPTRCIYEIPEGRKPLHIFEMMPWEEPTPSVPYRNSLMIGQGHNEAILRSHLAKHGVQVELNTELVDFEQTNDNVVAQIVKHSEAGDVKETVHAEYLVGADGARSFTRKKLGITFEGETRANTRLILIDVEIEGIGSEYWHSWGDGTANTVHLRPTEYPKLFSCIILKSYTHEDEIKSLMSNKEKIFEHIRNVTNRPELKFGEPTWLSDWRPNIRMADKFGVGRVFIAGDAAHVHPPTGGQGLNTGAQDSFNLAWKLALVYKGLASAGILESYTTERLPIISDMLGRTTTIMNETLRSKLRDLTAHVRPKILHQLGINCRWSPIVVDEQPEAKDAAFAGAYLEEDPSVLFAGDRAPDAPVVVRGTDATLKETTLFKIFGPTHHTVLIFTADDHELQLLGGVLRHYPSGTVMSVAVLAKDSAHATVPATDVVAIDGYGHAFVGYPPVTSGFRIIVVRPDGVVGAVVRGATGVQRYFDGIYVHC